MEIFSYTISIDRKKVSITGLKVFHTVVFLPYTT